MWFLQFLDALVNVAVGLLSAIAAWRSLDGRLKFEISYESTRNSKEILLVLSVFMNHVEFF